jgi:integrase
MPKWSGYHVKSDGRAYFRPYIPSDLKDHLGSYPMVNLGMKASRQAERLALMHFIAFEGLIEDKRRELAEEARRPRPRALSQYTEEEVRAFALETAQGLNREQHADIRSFTPREDLLNVHDLLSELAGDVLSASGMDGLAGLLGVFLRSAGVPYNPGETNFKTLVFEFATALDTDFIKPSRQRLHGREAVAPPPLPAKPTQLAAGLTLGMVIERHLGALKQTGYTRKVVRCLSLFGEVLGASTPVTAIRQKHVTDFLRDICRLPSDWAAQFDRGLSTVPQMLTGEVDQVMSPATYKDNYRAPLKAFLRDARRDYGDEGFPVLIVDGIEYTGDREPGEDEQRALTVPELKAMFEGPGFAAVAADPAQEDLYWLSIVGLFTGARPRELCQLNPQCDFGTAEGIPYLDFNKDSAAGKGVVKSIKTGEARRIPLHPELIRLGFPEYLKRMKDAGADRLLPGFRIKKGNPYEVAGGVFTEFLKAEGLYDNTAPPGRQVLGMYVMRKAFITHASNRTLTRTRRRRVSR